MPSLSNLAIRETVSGVAGRVLAPVPVAHEDIAVLGGDDVAREAEQPIGSVTRDTQLTERQQHLTLRTELDDHVALARRVGVVRVRAPPVGHPDVAVAVHVQPVREEEQPGTDGRRDVAVGVELENRVEVRPGAGVAATSVDGPQATIRVDINTGRRSPLPPVWELPPPVDAAIRIGQIVDRHTAVEDRSDFGRGLLFRRCDLRSTTSHSQHQQRRHRRYTQHVSHSSPGHRNPLAQMIHPRRDSASRATGLCRRAGRLYRHFRFACPG